MPLYTYIVTYNGGSCAMQARRSNYKGFADWVESARTCLPGLSRPAIKKELLDKAYRLEYVAMPSCSYAWQASCAIEGQELLVYVVETR